MGEPTLITRLLIWLDTSNARYESCAWACFAPLLAVAILSFVVGNNRSRVSRLLLGVFATTAFLCILAFRWQSLCANREIANPDESQLLAGAITLRHDPIFPRSVDGTTHGPADELALVAVNMLGVPFDYRLSHTVALGLALIGIVATWITLRHLFGDNMAQLAVLPLVAMVAFCDFGDFVQYSSEQLAAALIAVAISCMVFAWDSSGRLVRPFWLTLCGFTLGWLPVAKPQGVPVGLYCALSAVLLIWTTLGLDRPTRFKAVGLLVTGGLLVPTLFLICVLCWGQWGEFSQSYLKNNLLYSLSRDYPWKESPGRIFRIARQASGFAPFSLSGLAFLALAGVVVPPSFKSWSRRVAVLSLGLLLVSAFVVMAPGRDYYHYLQFLFFPIALSVGCLFGDGWRAVENSQRFFGPSIWSRLTLGLLYVGICVAPQVAWRVNAPFLFAGSYSTGGSVLNISEAAREILRHVKSTDSLAIWGWTPRLWVETGLWQGTRDGNTSRQIDPSPMGQYYKHRFVEDLERNRPAAFVDAVGTGNFISDRPAKGHECASLVAAYIDAKYRLAREVEGMRIYIRNDLH